MTPRIERHAESRSAAFIPNCQWAPKPAGAQGYDMPMNRAMSLSAALAVTLLLATAAGPAWYVFAPPLAEALPLASDLISADSAEGQHLLSESAHKTDHAQLKPLLRPQRRRAFCGPATSAAVINAALRPSNPVTQFSIFGTTTPHTKSELAVSLSGLTLEELAVQLRAHGLAVRTVHAEHTDVTTFRADAQTVLGERLAFMVVNYDRGALEQAGAGHISPLGAYDVATDRLLVMDVATYKYPYTWVLLSKLWDAMNTVDLDSARTRGYLVVTVGTGFDGTSGR